MPPVIDRRVLKLTTALSLVLFVVPFSQTIAAQTSQEKPIVLDSPKTAPNQTTTGKDALAQGQIATGSNAARESHRQANAKIIAAESNKKKAQELLNRCYHDALNIDPEAKAEALTRIAQSMIKVHQERALFIFHQAFEATLEIQSPGAGRRKASLQFTIAQTVAAIDPEKAFDMALKMDRVYPAGDSNAFGSMNFRNNALSSMASRLATKNPDRAFEVVEQQITDGNFEPSFIAPVAMQIRKSRPDKAEQLFIEAIHQFGKPGQDMFQVKSFVDLTARLFDLNHSLSAKALDLIIQSVDDLGKKQKDAGVSFTITMSNSQGKSSVNSIREYAAIEAVAMMRRLDPERAKTLEDSYAEYRTNISKNPNGIFPFGNDADTQTPGTNPDTAAGESLTQSRMMTTGRGPGPQRIVTGGGLPGGDRGASPGDGPAGQSVSVVIQQSDGASGKTPPPIDANALTAQLQSQIKTQQAIRQAQNNPDAALNTVGQIENPADRAKALARVAAALYKSDPDKSKSLLADAYTAAEKVSDPFDRAQIYGYLSDGYLNFDHDKAQSLLAEAFGLADKVMEDEAKQPSANPFQDRLLPEFRRSHQIYQQLLTSLGRLNIDEAIARADQISDKRLKLLTLVSIADSILNDGQTDTSGFRIVLRQP